mgnify:FL=1|tara:strand:+ start:196 stop:504 length:309 start_codon:yes stop_codon:yes gene_type:complete
MKVKDLKPGMMLVPAEDDRVFLSTTYLNNSTPWVRVVNKRLYKNLVRHGATTGPFMIYVGTKKDVDLDVDWCNRFALLNGVLMGVDPAAWKYIKPIEDGGSE